MCLTGNAYPHLEWGCASPGMHIVFPGCPRGVQFKSRRNVFQTRKVSIMLVDVKSLSVLHGMKKRIVQLSFT